MCIEVRVRAILCVWCVCVWCHYRHSCPGARGQGSIGPLESCERLAPAACPRLPVAQPGEPWGASSDSFSLLSLLLMLHTPQTQALT